MSIRRASHRRCRGLNLIEIAIVLAIAGLVTVGVFVAGSKISRNASLNDAGEQLSQIVHNVRSLYASQRGIYANNAAIGACAPANLTEKLSCQSVFPGDMLNGAPGTAPRHNVGTGGNVIVAPMTAAFATAAVAPGATSFSVRFEDLPLDACIALASRLSTPDQTTQLRALLFGSAARAFVAQEWSASANIGSLPVSPTVANTQCQAAAGANGTALEWVFMLR